MPEITSWLAAALILITATGLLLSRDWRWSLGLLVAQYFGMFLLLLDFWPMGMAAAKLITGWMAAGALLMTRAGSPARLPGEGGWPQGRPFRLFATILVVLAIASIVPAVPTWLPGTTPAHALAGLLLVGLGVLHLGMTLQPPRVVVALLTVLAGFEILYASVENSVLVAALLSALTLLLALVGSYLIIQTAAPAEAGT
jgi:hypothetical protein